MPISAAPRLPDQLVDLTALRDHLVSLEFNLLKILNGLFRLRALSLMRLSGRGQPLLGIVYGDGKRMVRRVDLAVSGGLRHADDFIARTAELDMAMCDDDGLPLVVAPAKSSCSRSYVQIHLDNELSKLDGYLLAGLPQIHRNFCGLSHHAKAAQLNELLNQRTFDICMAKVYELISPPVEATAEERREDRPQRYWLAIGIIEMWRDIFVERCSTISTGRCLTPRVPSATRPASSMICWPVVRRVRKKSLLAAFPSSSDPVPPASSFCR